MSNEKKKIVLDALINKVNKLAEHIKLLKELVKMPNAEATASN